MRLNALRRKEQTSGAGFAHPLVSAGSRGWTASAGGFGARNAVSPSVLCQTLVLCVSSNKYFLGSVPDGWYPVGVQM